MREPKQIQKAIVQASTALNEAYAYAPAQHYREQMQKANSLLSDAMAHISDLLAREQKLEAALRLCLEMEGNLPPRTVQIAKEALR